MEQIYIFTYTILQFLTQVGVRLELQYISFWRLQVFFIIQLVLFRSFAVDCILYACEVLIRVCVRTVTQLITGLQYDHTQCWHALCMNKINLSWCLRSIENTSALLPLSLSPFLFLLSGTFYFAAARLAVVIRLMLQFVNFNYGPLWTAPIPAREEIGEVIFLLSITCDFSALPFPSFLILTSSTLSSIAGRLKGLVEVLYVDIAFLLQRYYLLYLKKLKCKKESSWLTL